MGATYPDGSAVHISRKQAVLYGNELVRRALEAGNYADGAKAMLAARQDPKDAKRLAKVNAWGTMLLKGLGSGATTQQCDQQGKRLWGPGFSLPPLPGQGQGAGQPAPGQPGQQQGQPSGQPGQGQPSGQQQPDPAAPQAPGSIEVPAQAGYQLAGGGEASGKAGGDAGGQAAIGQSRADTGTGKRLREWLADQQAAQRAALAACQGPRAKTQSGQHRQDEGQQALKDTDWALVSSRAAKIRAALDAATRQRREIDLPSGSRVNLGALARTGASVSTRPFERRADSHSPSTALVLALDSSGSMAGEPLAAVRTAALAVSAAVGSGTVALAAIAYDGSARQLFDFRASPMARKTALGMYRAGGTTSFPRAGHKAVEMLGTRHEKRKALVILCDGDTDLMDCVYRSDPQGDTVVERAAVSDSGKSLALAVRRAGIEFHLVIAQANTPPKNYIDELRRVLPPELGSRISLALGSESGDVSSFGRAVIDAAEASLAGELRVAR